MIGQADCGTICLILDRLNQVLALKAIPDHEDFPITFDARETLVKEVNEVLESESTCWRVMYNIEERCFQPVNIKLNG